MSEDIDEKIEDSEENETFLNDSSFDRPDMYGFFNKVIKPSFADDEKTVLNSKIPIFTKDLKVSNITDQKDIDILNSAIFNLTYLKKLYNKLDNNKTDLDSTDFLSLRMNFILNVSSSRHGFERRIEHTKTLNTNKKIEDKADNKKSWFDFGSKPQQTFNMD